VPTLYFAREFVAAGGLASHGASFNEALHQAGVYAARSMAFAGDEQWLERPIRDC